jgi:hypothetical protein
VDPPADQVRDFLHERPQLGAATYVAGGEDFNETNNITVPVADRDAIGLVRVELGLFPPDQARARRGGRNFRRGRAVAGFRGPRCQMQG